MLALILAIVAGVLFFLDGVLWHTVPTHKSRVLVDIAGLTLAVAVVLLALGS